jgi:hypothetical protein
MNKMNDDQVDIRPGINMLGVLRHLNYKPWYALGEFVDNAVQSALANWDRLQELHGGTYKLKVWIELNSADGGSIVIRDNAAGIPIAEYGRAFKTAEVPPDREGLSEFGMGMKSAGFWFAKHWTVRSKALGEKRVGRVEFDLSRIMEDSLEVLPVGFETANASDHFTELTLSQIQKMPHGKTVAKIKDHLTSIYRQFLRDGRMELCYRKEQLVFKDPAILVAAHLKNGGESVRWLKPIDITLDERKRIHGFVGIREEGSLAEAGLALFRRNRLIVGSGDEGYRPEMIFGKSNDFRYQRVFGELHLEGFAVPHTKDGIHWDECEEEFLAKLREDLNKEPLPILRMAQDYRVRPKTVEVSRGAQSAVASTAALLKNAAPIIEAQRHESPISVAPPEILPKPSEEAAQREIPLQFRDSKWLVSVELVNDPSIDPWLEVGQCERGDEARNLQIRVNLAHPFMSRFGGPDFQEIEPFVRMAAAIAISEVVARDQGIRNAGTFKRHINTLLRSSFSGPSTGEIT